MYRSADNPEPSDSQKDALLSDDLSVKSHQSVMYYKLQNYLKKSILRSVRWTLLFTIINVNRTTPKQVDMSAMD